MTPQEVASHRRDAIADVSWGVAHDFSNLIQVMLGFAELIRAQRRDDPALMDSIEEIITASGRASALVRQLLVIGRQCPLELQAVDIHQAVWRLAASIRQLLGQHITLVLELEPVPVQVHLDQASFEQILHHLCAHALDAMPQGGIVTLKTAQVRLAGDGRHASCVMNAGDYLRLSIQDTGSGFDPALTARIFEPYFMKRRLGRGKGLELALVHELMEQHQGTIEIETSPGRGTAFHLYFPRVAEGTPRTN